MAFNFQPPPQGQVQQQQPAAPNPFGGPPQFGNRAPIDAAAAMAGLGAAGVIYDYLPTDGQFQVKFTDVRQDQLDGKLVVFFEVEVLKSSFAHVSGKRGIKLDGFGGQDTHQYAIRDMKSLMIACFGKQGITPEWKGDGQPGHWERFAAAVTAKQSPPPYELVGTVVNVATSTKIAKKRINPATGKGYEKLKCSFHAI